MTINALFFEFDIVSLKSAADNEGPHTLFIFRTVRIIGVFFDNFFMIEVLEGLKQLQFMQTCSATKTYRCHVLDLGTVVCILLC
jgi:hypothetical protein